MRDDCLLDSNILLRTERRLDAGHPSIERAIRALQQRGCRLCYTSQCLGEFWNVSTRPLDRNGFGLNVQGTDRLVRTLESRFKLLADSQAVHDVWRQLLVTHQISGAKVHDARIAASMYVHGVARILTLNGRDFKRFDGLIALHLDEL